MLERIASLFRRPESPVAGELNLAERRAQYLSALSEIDRNHLLQLLGYIERLRQPMQGVDIAVVAIGSTTRSERERDHPVEDIDIKILTSPQSIEERSFIAQLLKLRIAEYYFNNNLPYEGSTQAPGFTELKVKTRDPATGKTIKTMGLFDNFYAYDPSLIAQYSDGLPIHISISGKTGHDLNRHLDMEGRHKTSAVVLLSPSLPLTTRRK